MTTDASDADALRKRLFAAISPSMRVAIERVVAAAAPDSVFVAGGAVRDLFVQRAIIDIDLVTESDAIDIARSAFPSAAIAMHEAFRTASVEIDGVWLDLATSRTEVYARPGALPEVSRALIEDDLRRRDFTVNGIALRLDREAELIDPNGGVRDLQARLIRVLHDGSFRDDATRIFRAHRYAARLGFSIDAETQTLIGRDTPHVDTIGGERLRRELTLLLLDTPPGRALETLAAAGVLRAVRRGLSWDARRSEALGRSLPPDVSSVEAGFALLGADASPEEAGDIIDRLRLTRHESEAVRGVVALRGAAAMLRRPEAKPSGIVVLLDRVPAASIAAFTATEDDSIAGAVALRYLDEWRHVKPSLKGDALLAMGVPEGPQVKLGLQLLRAARLDGIANDVTDEQALAIRFVQSIRDAKTVNAPIDLQFNGN